MQGHWGPGYLLGLKQSACDLVVAKVGIHLQSGGQNGGPGSAPEQALGTH